MIEYPGGKHVAQMQLVMDANSITLHASLMPGVLTSQTFEGNDCYQKFVHFMKQISTEWKTSSVIAEIIIP
ncbi:MAG TPA: hypothetical protein VNI77_05025 [Nitrososphaera sp.]|nr:hypothetical protein [Nitrososphaera sp.]